MHASFVRTYVLPLLVVPSAAFALAGSASAQTQIAGWGYRVFDSRWTTEPFTDVSCGNNFTLAVRTNGQIAAWGLNQHGNCEPPAPPPGTTFVEVSAGHDHALARLNTGVVIGWGNNVYGKATSPGGTFAQISTGLDYSLGLRPNGQLSAWGSNNFLQLNLPFPPAGLTYTQVSAGRHYGTALRSDGQILAWGHNGDGQCNVPALPAGLTYVEVSAGSGSDAHVVARRSDGSVVAWGDNTYGQLNVPALPAGVTYVDVEAGSAATLAKRSDGVVVMWPNPSQLPAYGPTTIVELDLGVGGALRRANGVLISFADNYWSNSNAPALAAGLSYTDVVAGRGSFYALVSDGTARAWGYTLYNACNLPGLSAGLQYVELYGGVYGGAALVSNGSLRFWGDYYDAFNFQSLSIPAGLVYVAADVGSIHALALRSDGTVVAWGNNSYGQLNVTPLPAGAKYTGVAAGGYHSLALRDDGEIVGWGDNASGQLNVPALPAGVRYVRVLAHERESAALRSDGNYVAWGEHPLSPTPAFGTETADLGLCGTYQIDPYGFESDYAFIADLHDDGSVTVSGDNTWHQLHLPVLPAGHAFRAIDARGLSGAGVYGPNHGLSSPFCTSAVTVGGCTPLISGNGQASASAATPFSLEVEHVDGQRSGILFYGTNNAGFTPLSWFGGSSALCVQSPLQRTALQTSGGTVGLCDGGFALDWNAYVAANPTALGAPFAAGERIFVQGWFRDSAAPGGTNLSNAFDAAIWP